MHHPCELHKASGVWPHRCRLLSAHALAAVRHWGVSQAGTGGVNTARLAAHESAPSYDRYPPDTTTASLPFVDHRPLSFSRPSSDSVHRPCDPHKAFDTQEAWRFCRSTGRLVYCRRWGGSPSGSGAIRGVRWLTLAGAAQSQGCSSHREKARVGGFPLLSAFDTL